MINMKKIGKKVWYDEQLYDVYTVLSPNKFDDFIILRRNNPDGVHEDGVTTPVEMFMLDCHNDTFYPDSAKVRTIMKRRAALRKQLDLYDSENLDKEVLSDCWLSVFPRD